MKVRMLVATYYPDAGGRLVPGDVVDVPDKKNGAGEKVNVGQAWIDGGIAEAVTESSKKGSSQTDS